MDLTDEDPTSHRERPVLRLVAPLAPEPTLPACEQDGGCESCSGESLYRLCDGCMSLGVELTVAAGRCHLCGRRCGGLVCAPCSARRYALTHTPVGA